VLSFQQSAKENTVEKMSNDNAQMPNQYQNPNVKARKALCDQQSTLGILASGL
jgi:hypothetical protein